MNDANLIDTLVLFVKKRETVLSSKPDRKNIKKVYNSFIKPILGLSPYKIQKSTEDKIKFIGELFALSVYYKLHPFSTWKYEPKLKNGLTPDFLIDDNYYVEIYSPALNHVCSNLNYYLKKDNQNRFSRRNMETEIQDKINKYKNEKLIIIVQILCGEFLSDLIYSLKDIKMRKSHKLYLYHGSKEINYE